MSNERNQLYSEIIHNACKTMERELQEHLGFYTPILTIVALLPPDVEQPTIVLMGNAPDPDHAKSLIKKALEQYESEMTIVRVGGREH
jgi:hypothetical protein